MMRGGGSAGDVPNADLSRAKSRAARLDVAKDIPGTS